MLEEKVGGSGVGERWYICDVEYKAPRYEVMSKHRG